MTVQRVETVAVTKPPNRLWKHQLPEMLAWYKENLCDVDLRDPRDNRLIFSLERFPHMIKLLRRGSDLEVERPQKVIRAIMEGTKSNGDFGGYDEERAQTLTWIPLIISEPSMILEVVEKTLWEKPGDTIYVKEFDKRGYRHKILVCRTVGTSRLAPITSHPRTDGKFSTAYKIVWRP
jgi:hypothetical protein